MKKIILVGMMLMAFNVFAQTTINVPLNKDQEKRVKVIQKETQQKVDKVVNDPQMSVETKKNEVRLIRENRNAQLNDFMTTEQFATLMQKDPIKWENAGKEIDKKEKERLKAAQKSELDALAVHQRDLDRRKADLDKQQKELNIKKSELSGQQKDLKNQQKAIKTKYK